MDVLPVSLQAQRIGTPGSVAGQLHIITAEDVSSVKKLDQGKLTRHGTLNHLHESQPFGCPRLEVHSESFRHSSCQKTQNKG